MRAAIYIRVSDKEQERGASLDLQREHCERFIDGEGWTVAGVWQDVLSGRRPDRPGYQSMLAAHRDYDLVVCWRFDRFGRQEAEYFVAMANLQRAGIQVLSATEPNGHQFVTGVLALVAANESRDIGKRVAANMEEWARRGKFQAPAPYGYRWEHGDLVIDEPTATIYREIVARMIAGETRYQIAQSLNQRDIPGPRGGVWWPVAIGRICRSGLPAGWIEWKGNPRFAESRHPRLIERDQWEALQRVMDGRSVRQVRASDPTALLVGFVRCGRCQGRMIKTVVSGYAYWKCLHRAQMHTCVGERSIANKVLERALEERMADLFALPVAELVRRALAGQSDEERRQGETRHQLEREQREVQAELDGLVRLAALDRLSLEDFDRMSHQARDRKQHIEDALQRLTVSPPEDIQQRAQTFHRLGQVWEIAALKDKRWLLNELGLTMTVYREALVFSWSADVTWMSREPYPIKPPQRRPDLAK